VSPYAGRNCTAGQTAFYGAVDHYLGVLCATVGNVENAIGHFESALDRHVAMGAEPFVAMTQAALADQLAQRRERGDRARDAELRSAATATATRLGLTALLVRPVES